MSWSCAICQHPLPACICDLDEEQRAFDCASGSAEARLEAMSAEERQQLDIEALRRVTGGHLYDPVRLGSAFVQQWEDEEMRCL